jgi:hypothetical protein
LAAARFTKRNASASLGDGNREATRTRASSSAADFNPNSDLRCICGKSHSQIAPEITISAMLPKTSDQPNNDLRRAGSAES